MKHQKGFAPIIIIMLVVLGLMVAGGGYAVYKNQQQMKNFNAGIQDIFKQPAPDTTSSTSTTPSTNNPTSNTTPVFPTTNGSQNCSNDKDCFITAAKSCLHATGDWSITLNIFGFNETTNTQLTIKGLDEAKQCSFSDLVIDASISVPVDVVAKAKAQGTTDAEIQAQTAAISKSVQSTVGFLTTCKFPSSILATLLTNWKAGNLSSTDLNSDNCTVVDAKGNAVPLADKNGRIHFGGNSGAGSSQQDFIPDIYPGETLSSFTSDNLSVKANTISQTQLVALVTNKNTGKSQTVTVAVGQSASVLGHTLTFKSVFPYNGSYGAAIEVK